MKKPLTLLAFLLGSLLTHAGELRVSTAEPIVAVAPDGWQASKFAPAGSAFPNETYQIQAPAARNAALLVSVADKDKIAFADPEFLKKLLRAGCNAYVSSPDELSKLPLKELTIKGGLGYCASFVDPDLVGKPVEKGAYKVATPVILSLDSKYLLKVTIFCDQTNGTDYQDAIRIVESIKIKTD